MTDPTATAPWKALERHAAATAARPMRDLFAADPRRAEKFSLALDELLFDYSKNRIDAETVDLLVSLAEACDLRGFIERMFRGERINATENRAVLHVALRDLQSANLLVDGKDVLADIALVRQRVGDFAERVRDGRWRGATGSRIRTVINIGIGGSDLGPAMATEALAAFKHEEIDFRFVSNVDGTAILQAIADIDAASTLFIVASKTFTTQETMTNAATARAWLVQRLGEAAVPRHFVAVSTNAEAVRKFGIDADNMFGFWDWVGGRYSLWSAIGLPIVIAIGAERFRQFLEGAQAVDRHFRSAPFHRNIPVMMALIGIWNVNFLKCTGQAILPYEQSLARFPAYLQQADMESNGKSVGRDGKPVRHHTGPMLWGEPGTNGQHAFYQLLHQGTEVVPADFHAAARSQHALGNHHRILLANFLAQSQALMQGKSEAEARAELSAQGLSGEALERLLPHKVFAGNRPSNSFLFRELDPRTLGMLIALYEHKIFTQGVIWNIHSFDQWGVELGKQLANHILPALEGKASTEQFDSSTARLVAEIRRLRGEA